MRSLVYFFLCIMLFLVPWENLVAFGEFGTLVRLVGYATALLAVVAVLTNGIARPFPAVFWLLVIFWLWTVLSLSWSIAPLVTQSMLVTSFSLLIFLWLIWEFTPYRKQQLWLMRVYLLGCLVSLLMLYANFVTGRGAWWMSGSRYSAAGLNANQLAAILVFACPISMYLATQAKGVTGKFPVHYWVMILMSAVGVFLTGSRAGVLCVLAFFALAILASVGMTWKTRIMLVISVCCLVALIYTVVPEFLLERMGKMREKDISDISPDRMRIWTLGWEVFLNNMLIGVGLQCYSPAITGDLNNLVLPAHNMIFSLLVELGIIGITLYFIFLFGLLFRTFKMEGSERSLWIGTLAIWGLFSLTAPMEYLKITWFIFAMLLSQSATLPAVKPRAAPLPWRSTMPAGRSFKMK